MATRVTPDCEQIPINIVGSSSFGRYPKISLEKTYNMFESDNWLVDFPGYQKVLEMLPGGIEGRGLYKSFRGNLLVAVVDGNVYKIDKTLSSTLIGTLNTFNGNVFIDENLNNQICIVDGLNAYIYNWSLGGPKLTVQTGGAFASGALIPGYVTYHNEFFLFGNSRQSLNGAFWYAYVFSDNTHIVEAPNGQMTIQTKPDYALAIKRIPGQGSNVIVMGGLVSEIHTQIAATSFQPPYIKNQSFNIDYGVLSVDTIADNDTYIVWLGINQSNSVVILALSGQTLEKISTDGIDYLLGSLNHPEMSTGMMYTVDGQLFYHFTFYHPMDNLSLVYNFNNKKFYHVSDHNLDFHPAREVVFFNQNTTPGSLSQDSYFISISGGALYRFSTDITFINEDIPDPQNIFVTDPRLKYEIPRIRICKEIRFPTSAPFKINQLVFTLEMGVDQIPAVQDCLIYMITESGIRMFSEDDIQLVPEKGGIEDCVSRPYQARVDLSISKDGCETWGNYVSRFCHPAGKRKNMMRWEKQGYANDYTPKFKFWSLGRFVVSDGLVEVTP
jgi:hypothetical protein